MWPHWFAPRLVGDGKYRADIGRSSGIQAEKDDHNDKSADEAGLTGRH